MPAAEQPTRLVGCKHPRVLTASACLVLVFLIRSSQLLGRLSHPNSRLKAITKVIRMRLSRSLQAGSFDGGSGLHASKYTDFLMIILLPCQKSTASSRLLIHDCGIIAGPAASALDRI